MIKRPKIIEKELSFEIIGLLFKIHTKLGGRYQEKYYQRAVSLELNKRKIPFKGQLFVDLDFDGDKIGCYVLDFLIDNRIILELKAVPALHPQDFRQISAYLKARGLELGIIANFRGPKLTYKRILNPDIPH